MTPVSLFFCLIEATDINFTNEELKFKRKISIVFPCLKELKRPELEELHSKICHQRMKLEDACFTLPLIPTGNEEDDGPFIYMIKSGMFKIESESTRTVKYLSNSDFFGLFQLIASDIKMLVSPMDSVTFYKVRIEVVENFMNKYPYLRKVLYSRALQNYIKCCSSTLSRTKTRYFRRLRRLSPSYIENILDDGKIMCFSESKEMLNYFYDEHYSSIGIFALKGSFKVVHEDPTVTKAKQLFKFKELNLIRNFLKNKTEIKKFKEYGSKRKILTEDFYSIKRTDTKEFDEDKYGLNEIQINPGNAIKIHPDFLEKIEFIDSEIMVFVIEAQVCLTKEDKVKNRISKRNIGSIKRKTYL